MSIAKFFQNEKADWKIVQPPSALLWIWLVVQIVNFVLFESEHHALIAIASLLLFAWSYGELRQGESPFRKVLGGSILAVIILNLFI